MVRARVIEGAAGSVSTWLRCLVPRAGTSRQFHTEPSRLPRTVTCRPSHPGVVRLSHALFHLSVSRQAYPRSEPRPRLVLSSLGRPSDSTRLEVTGQTCWHHLAGRHHPARTGTELSAVSAPSQRPKSPRTWLDAPQHDSAGDISPARSPPLPPGPGPLRLRTFPI